MIFIRRELHDREYEESIRSVFSSLDDKIHRVLLLDVLLSIYRTLYCLRFLSRPSYIPRARVTSALSSLHRERIFLATFARIIRYIGDVAIRVRDEINELPR